MRHPTNVFPQLTQFHKNVSPTKPNGKGRKNHKNLACDNNSIVGNASVSSVATNRSIFSQLTASPYHHSNVDSLIHPISDIRRAMLLKKRKERQSEGDSLTARAINTTRLRALQKKKKTPLESATEKVLAKAKQYDRYKQGSVLQDCFADYSMESPEFRRTMKKALGIALTKKEASAILHAFDKDGNGLLDGAEFLQLFFRTAHDEHTREFRIIQEKKLADRRLEKEKKQREKETIIRVNESCVDWNFVEEDTKRVLRKLAKISSLYDILSENGKRISAQFQCILRPYQLKITLQKCFGLALSKKELGALVSYFDQDGDGDVSGAEFLVSFTKLGSIQRKLDREKRDAIIRKKRESGLLLPLMQTSLGR